MIIKNWQINIRISLVFWVLLLCNNPLQTSWLHTVTHAHKFCGSRIRRWRSRENSSLLHSLELQLGGLHGWRWFCDWGQGWPKDTFTHMSGTWAGRTWRRGHVIYSSLKLGFLTAWLPSWHSSYHSWGFQEEGSSKPGRNCTAFYHPAWKVTKLHFNQILLVSSPPCSEEGKPRSTSVSGEMSKKSRAIFPNLHHN